MVKYYLVQEIKKDLHIIDFSKIDGYGEFNSTNLKDIIIFTGMYKNEEELKHFLIQHNLIKEDNFNKNLKITYKYKKQDKTLIYGITYEDDLKFFNEVNIRKFLAENSKNYDLLEVLCNHYRNSYHQGLNIDTIRAYIRFSKQYTFENNTDYLDDDKKQQLNEYEKAINNFVFRELYNFDKKNMSYKENFKGLRDLAMFLSYQIKKQNKQLENENIELVQSQQDTVLKIKSEQCSNNCTNILENKEYETIELSKATENKVLSKSKKKKKDKNILGQLTFEDMGWQ